MIGYSLRLFYKMPWVVPAKFVVPDELTGRTRVYRLSYLGRFFMTLDGHFTDSRLSFLLGLCLQSINILSPIINILVTTPVFQYQPATCDKPACDNHPDLCPGFQMCEPQGNKLLIAVDDFLLIFVAVEFMLRVMTCWSVPLRLNGLLSDNFDEEMEEKFQKLSAAERLVKMRDPTLPAFTVIMKYMLKLQSVMDILLLLPLYISLLPHTWSHDENSFVRSFRLLRVMQLMKISHLTMSTTVVLRKAIAESLPSVGVITVLFIILLVLFGSLLYHAEKGNFVVNGEFPTGEYLTRSLTPGSFQIASFRSIAEGIYFSGITLATVGYGDIFPVSPAGRFLASVMAFIGSLVLAIPTAVLGNNFTANYNKYVIGHVLKDQEREAFERHKKKRIRTLIRKEKRMSPRALTASLSSEANNLVAAADRASVYDSEHVINSADQDEHLDIFGLRRFRAFCLLYLRHIGVSTSFADDVAYSPLNLLQAAGVKSRGSLADAVLEAQFKEDWEDAFDTNSVDSEVDVEDYDDEDGDSHQKLNDVNDAEKGLGITDMDSATNKEEAGVESASMLYMDNPTKESAPTGLGEDGKIPSKHDVQILMTLEKTLRLYKRKSTKNYQRLVDNSNKAVDMISKTTDHIENKLRKFD